MADKDNIDKALPNVDPEVVLPEDQIVVTEEDKLSEVTPDGAEVIWMKKVERKLISIPRPIDR